MRRKFREVKPPEFLEGFLNPSSIVRLRLLSRGQGDLRVPTSWGAPLHHLKLLCELTGVEIDLREVALLPKRSDSYTNGQWLELMSSALVAAGISAAYMSDERAMLVDATVRREQPEVEVMFKNMTSDLLALCPRRCREARSAQQEFGEGNARVVYLSEMEEHDLDNVLRVSSLLSFFSMAASLFVRATMRRQPEQSPEQVLRAAIECLSDAIEAFYFG